MENLEEYIREKTNCSLSYSYFELMQYIVRNNRRVLGKVLNREKVKIDIWDYVMEDYSKLQEQIDKCRERLGLIGERIANDNDDGLANDDDEETSDMEYLRMLIEDEYGGREVDADNRREDGQLGDVESQLYKVTTPSKINLVIGQTNSGQTNPTTNISKQFWFFALTHFNYSLLFLLFLYYTINPALLSLPLLIYIFPYYLIADIKHNHYLFLYIFLLVLLA
jgi:hypothetical protein